MIDGYEHEGFVWEILDTLNFSNPSMLTLIAPIQIPELLKWCKKHKCFRYNFWKRQKFEIRTEKPCNICKCTKCKKEFKMHMDFDYLDEEDAL